MAGSVANAGWVIREGRDADGDGIIALIASCWSQYPRVIMDVDREMPELRALDSYYRRNGGRLWIAESDARLRGMIAVRPSEPPGWEICRVYVDPRLHGSGLGHALLDRAEGHAVVAGARRLALWSDTRFHRAHRFYQKRGYARVGPVRVLNDLSNSEEFGYVKQMDGSAAEPDNRLT